MRLAHRAQGRFPVQDAAAFVRFRRLADRLANAVVRPPRDVELESASVGGVRGDWLVPPGAPADPLQVWHSWHALAPQLPEATQALEALGKTIRQRV